MSQLERRWVEAAGYRMHARVGERAGAAAPAVVLVHGLGVSSRYMVRVAERLARDVRVYAPDLPGFGASEKPEHVLDVEALADVLAAWMDAVGLGGALLLGNSLGCQIIAEVGVRRPDLVAAAVLVGPTIDPAGRFLPRLLARAVADVVREHVSLLPILAYDYLRAGVVRTFRTLQILTRHRLEDGLPALAVPTLVVRGEHDMIVPQAWAEAVVRLLPDGRLAVVPGGAHAVHYDSADVLAALVRRLLAERAG